MYVVMIAANAQCAELSKDLDCADLLRVRLCGNEPCMTTETSESAHEQNRSMSSVRSLMGTSVPRCLFCRLGG